MSSFVLMKRSFLIIALAILTLSCNQDYSPKPKGYPRIELPEKKYTIYNGPCPFTFNYPAYARVVPDSSRDTEPCWLNVQFPQFKGTIHLSYKAIASEKMFRSLIEDAHTLAFKHTVKAEGIEESLLYNPDKKVYGLYYAIAGNTASAVQFYLTDSTRHFLRGSLYFMAEPKVDSLQPVLDFVKQDIDVMIKSFRWK